MERNELYIRRLRRAAWTLAVVFAFLFSVWFTDCDVPLFLARREHLSDIVSKMIPPDVNYMPKIFAPLLATVQMSVTGTALGAFLALLAAPLCASHLKGSRPLRIVLRTLIQVLRSFPALILALIATFVFGLGTFAGTVAILLYTFAIITRLTYEDIEAAPLSAYDALLAMGTTGGKAYFRTIVPEIAPSYLTNVLYLLETNVRHSSILGYVGAGGLGLLLNEKVSWREYDKVGMMLILLFLTVCVIEGLSHLLAEIVRGEIEVPTGVKRGIIASLAIVFVISTVTVAPPDFSHTSFTVVKNMFYGFVHPSADMILDFSDAGLLYLLLETMCISLAGTLLGTVIAVPLAFLNTPRLMPAPLALAFRIVVMAIRSVPFLIYGLIFIRVTGPGAFAGVLTLSLCSVGLLTKRFTEALESLDFRAYRALSAMGVRPLLCLRYAVIPQLAPLFASAVLYRFDINLREASVLGLVGAGGIGAPLVFAMSHFHWSDAGAIALGLIVLVWIIDVFSTKVRRNLK